MFSIFSKHEWLHLGFCNGDSKDLKCNFQVKGPPPLIPLVLPWFLFEKLKMYGSNKPNNTTVIFNPNVPAFFGLASVILEILS